MDTELLTKTCKTCVIVFPFIGKTGNEVDEGSSESTTSTSC